ncbi:MULTISPECIES: hypothetical protein [Rhizobium]|jgi:hypothetical protein|uniref:hypothetical protein n=1 Tax=Rhizobium TaxID=379 RepID=UPI0010321910|nr:MULTISPECIES: hypothetical protein [Rhizobium]TAZ83263.1 hypothetical protein ELH72_08310 [Rhizobium ruizarguesonis]TBZ93185.1 hypothetical protein E0H63_36095 [Rhizobium leguminosarum bv. viciae]
MKPAVRKLARAGADVAFLVRALSSSRCENDDDQTTSSSPDWPDEHMPDVVEFVDASLKTPLAVGGANA